ncbi:MAG: tRNA lysidine(34) synthetase TilS [Firmicutes bacterium]|nr:tRNA lysidine(34) synthetase TilS [Bacillota bacterium]
MEEAYSFLFNDLNIKYGDFLVVATSGGPDSMSLLYLLLKLKKAIDIEIVCAHVNHNTGRIGQKEEQEFVEKYCRNNNIIFETMVIEDYGDDNFHSEAHTKRYNFFKNIIKKYHAKYLFTAHHGDDLIETILMRIVRGSTLKGYSGFSKIVDADNYKIVRPLIHVTKEEILEFCKNNTIPYAIDSSNKKDVYTRNRFRKYIVPELKKEEKNVHQKFYKFSKTLLEYNNYIDKQVEKKINVIYPDSILNIEKFKEEDHVIQMKIIYYILEHIYQDDLMLITDRHAEILYELIHSKKANSLVHLPNNIQARKTYNNLVLIENPISNSEYEIELIEHVNLPNGKNIEFLEESEETNNYICYLDSKEVKLPLHVRSRKDGDKMHVLGMVGRKKINDIFIDSKVTKEERDIWPIVVDSNENIVWLPGLKKSKFDKTKQGKYDIILKYY